MKTNHSNQSQSNTAHPIDTPARPPRSERPSTKRELEKEIVDSILSQSYDKRIRPGGYNNQTGQNGE